MIRRLFATTGRLVMTILTALAVLGVAVLVMAAWQGPPEVLRLPDVAVGDRAFPATMQAHADALVVGGNAVDVLLNGDQIFPAKIAAIRSAKTSIAYAEYFYAEGEPGALIAAALAERCRAGVPVKILLDGVGALAMEEAHRKTMEDAGCRVVTFRPIGRLTIRRNNDRNHRRILVVDGRTGITGGSGVSFKWMGNGRKQDHWRDTDVRVDGPVVDQLQAAFAENWREATGEVLGGPAWFPPAQLPRGAARAHVVRSSPAAGDYGLYSLFLLAIAGSRTSLDITNPYFVPDDRLSTTLRDAARRGVRVRVLVPGVIDHAIVREAGRRHFGDMMKAGIEFYEYKPALLHAKTMVVDGMWATVGSTNLDRRSFALNDELNLAVYDPGVASALARAFAADLEVSERVTLEAWQRRPLKGRIFELISIPLAPLL